MANSTWIVEQTSRARVLLAHRHSALTALHNRSLCQLVCNPVLEVFLLFLLALVVVRLDFVLIRADSLHIVAPTVDRLKTVTVKMLNVASIARHDQPILLFVHNARDLWLLWVDALFLRDAEATFLIYF